MQKKILLLLFILSPLITRAQWHRAFLDKNGGQVDSADAKSYILYRQLPDSSWEMRQFEMHNISMMTGIFKDRNLQVPNGKFTYYHAFDIYLNSTKSRNNTLDAENYVHSYGNYVNGTKEGKWVDLFDNGNKEYVNFYKNGVLNGRYESYNFSTNALAIEGNYIDGLREGDWHILNYHGDVVETDTYAKNKVINIVKLTGKYKPSHPTKEFYDFINDKLGKLINDRDKMDIPVQCYVTSEGNITGLNIVLDGHHIDLEKNIIFILTTSPPWTPASVGTDDKHVDEVIQFTIEIKKGKITITNIESTSGAFYNRNN
jgi:antitoxin component YwqK of YwqJK toxin-antitoxin module